MGMVGGGRHRGRRRVDGGALGPRAGRGKAGTRAPVSSRPPVGGYGTARAPSDGSDSVSASPLQDPEPPLCWPSLQGMSCSTRFSVSVARRCIPNTHGEQGATAHVQISLVGSRGHRQHGNGIISTTFLRCVGGSPRPIPGGENPSRLVHYFSGSRASCSCTRAQVSLKERQSSTRPQTLNAEQPRYWVISEEALFSPLCDRHLHLEKTSPTAIAGGMWEPGGHVFT